MQLPQKYPYNPRWKSLLLVVVFFGGCAFILAYMAGNPNEGISSIPVLLGTVGAAALYWVAATLSAVFVLIALVFLGRRFVVTQFLELQQNELVLPRGFFRTHLTRIPYAQIERVWEAKASGQSYLWVRVNGLQYQIMASLLPNDAIYSEVRNFLLAGVPHPK